MESAVAARACQKAVYTTEPVAVAASALAACSALEREHMLPLASEPQAGLAALVEHRVPAAALAAVLAVPAAYTLARAVAYRPVGSAVYRSEPVASVVLAVYKLEPVMAVSLPASS